MRRKVLASLGLGRHAQLLELTRPSFERYADRHGYELSVPTTDPAPERRHKHWAKIALINRLLPECDLLLWVDADAAIVDSSVDIEEAMPEASRLGLVAHRYSGQLVPNTGVMLVRSTHSSRRFFQKVWGMTQYLETTWHDNAAVLTLLGFEFDFDADPMWCRPHRQTRWRRQTTFLDREWNSLPEDTAAAPRIVHVTSSHPFEERLGRLERALAGGDAGLAATQPGSDKENHPRVGAKKGSPPRTHPRVIGAPR
ncbi:MAG: DUF273 domain-containing protein [Acidimicrobiales bacterium]